MCLVGIGIATHSDWKYVSFFFTSIFFQLCLYLLRLEDNDDFQSENDSLDDSVSTPSTLLSTTAANTCIHSPKNATSTIRRRMQRKSSDGECQHGHSHHSHHHPHGHM